MSVESVSMLESKWRMCNVEVTIHPFLYPMGSISLSGYFSH